MKAHTKHAGCGHTGPPRRSARSYRGIKAQGLYADVVMDVVMFRDGPDGKPSEAVHLLFSGETLRHGELCRLLRSKPSMIPLAFG